MLTIRLSTEEIQVLRELSHGMDLSNIKTPAGIYKNYPFEQTYQVTPPSVTVSATKMNVFYRGIDNPVDVAVPGVPKGKSQSCNDEWTY